jgi:hypothetical protein
VPPAVDTVVGVTGPIKDGAAKTVKDVFDESEIEIPDAVAIWIGHVPALSRGRLQDAAVSLTMVSGVETTGEVPKMQMRLALVHRSNVLFPPKESIRLAPPKPERPSGGDTPITCTRSLSKKRDGISELSLRPLAGPMLLIERRAVVCESGASGEMQVTALAFK